MTGLFTFGKIPANITMVKKHEIPDLDRETIKRIATKAKEIRVSQGYSYESFALHARINRNTYFKFENSSSTGDNFTIAVLAKVLRGLNLTFESFFQNL
jgi:DNA-binding XRE family transcriptional regulator